jgi:hypothetical protein
LGTLGYQPYLALEVRKEAMTMTDVPHEICEIVRRIDEAKSKSELDNIDKKITPEIWELLGPVLGAHAPQAELRPGQESPGDALGEVGTPSGNRFYIIAKHNK